MVDYAPPCDGVPRERLHGADDMPLLQPAAALAALLDEKNDEQVLKEACFGLCKLFGEGIQIDRIQAILEADVVPKLVALLHPSKSRQVSIAVQSAALQVLGNVACGDDRQTQVVIDSHALPCLRALLLSADRGIRKRACWIVSNITETSYQIQNVLDADILPLLLKLLDNQDAVCLEYATWVLFNVSCGRVPNRIAYLAEKNGVRAFCNLLNCSKELHDQWKGCKTFAAVALKGLRNILTSGQIAAASHPNGYNKMAFLVAEAHGVERIDALTSHVSPDVRTRARLLLERVFGAEPTTADLSLPLVPPVVTGQYSLSSPPPPSSLEHSGGSFPYSPHQQNESMAACHGGLYNAASNTDAHANGLHPSPHIRNGMGLDHGLKPHAQKYPEEDFVDVMGSTVGSLNDSDSEDDDSDSDLILQPRTPCSCVLCTDSSPLAERKQKGKVSLADSGFQRKHVEVGCGGSGEIRQICNFCSGGGRIGDGRAGLAAKLGRAVRLGHPHCVAILLSTMTWSQRVAATETQALLHPGRGSPDGGVGSSLPVVVLAAQLGKPDCLSLLLKRCQPDLDVTHGKKRLTALAWAAQKGYLRCCQLLIDHGAKPMKRCGDGVTALHLAASGGGHIEICKLLIDHKAPVNARCVKSQTPLCLAAQKGFVNIVQMLIEHGADPNNEDEGKYTPLHLSASNGFVKSVDLLLKAGARVDAKTHNGVTPLHYAVQGGRVKVIKLLIAAGAKVNCDRNPLLLIAAYDGNLEIVQILLDARANIGYKANIKAMLDTDVEIFDYLNPLHLASSKGHNDVVKFLLRRGSLVNELTTKSGWSALDFAVISGHADCAVTLLKYGATITDNCKSIGRNNWTLVKYAAHHQEKDLVILLIQRLKEQRMNNLNGFMRASCDGGSKSNATFRNGEESYSTSNTANGPSRGRNVIHSERGVPNFNHSIPEGTDYDTGQYITIEEDNIHDETGHHHHHHHMDEDGAGVSTYQNNDPKSPDWDESAFISGYRKVNGSSSSESSTSNTSQRRVVKDERKNALHAREIKKREAEATEARERLDEAISQRSVSKLTEAIDRVRKLFLHLATAVGGDVSSSGENVDHGSINDYCAHGDSYCCNHVHSPGGGHGKHAGSTSGSTILTAPLAVEVGLGNEVKKARKILAGLLAEEKRLREEKEKEIEDTKRENTQQTVRKAISAALEGGDPRSLLRVSKRAVRTILEKDDPVVVEATSVSGLISELEKWESTRKIAVSKMDLDGLAKTLPEVLNAVSQLKGKGGNGAALRLFDGTVPSKALQESSDLLKDLQAKRESEIAKEAEARHLEKLAHRELSKALESHDIITLEKALDCANAALLSKESELSATIVSAKKVMKKRLKAERRKLRQANNSNDPFVIEKATSIAEAFGLHALQGDIDSAKEHAQKLRKQEEAVQMLKDATAHADLSSLKDIRNQLNTLGMFEDAEKARSELEMLQRVMRARNLLEGAIEDAKQFQELFNEALNNISDTSLETVLLQSFCSWPDAERLVDLSERARKYSQAMLPLCDSADQLYRDLAILGRRVLALTTKSQDARAIAAVIAGYEKSFVKVSKPNIFNSSPGERSLREAKERLAVVQAMDQASVKAESAKVKVEYALAKSRRSEAFNRRTEDFRSHQQGPSGRNKFTGNATTSNGSNATEYEVRSPSSLSPDYADDDWADSDSAPGVSLHVDVTSYKTSETHRINVSRRARLPNSSEDSVLLDEVRDDPAPVEECSHFSLFKEGSTVCCTRRQHLRNSGNPALLARVKRSGNKVPTEIAAASLTSLGTATDIQTSFASTGSQLGDHSRSPPVGSNGSTGIDRNLGRSGRGPGHTFPIGILSNGRDGARASPLSGSTNTYQGGMNMMAQISQQQLLQQQNFQKSHPQSSQNRQPSSQQHLQGALQQSHLLHSQGLSKPQGQHSQTGKSEQVHQRGHGRSHIWSREAVLDQHFGGLTNMYGAGLGNGCGLGFNSWLPLTSNSNASSLQSLAPGMSGQGTQMNGLNEMGNSMTALYLRSGLAVHGDIGFENGATQGGLSLDGIGQGGCATGVLERSGRATTVEEMGVSALDFEIEFVNENFGFAINAIVNDNPSPCPSKRVGGQEGGGSSESGKDYVGRSLAQQN